MIPLHYRHYVRVRVRPTCGFGYLADRAAVDRLVTLGRSVPTEAFLIDAGDAVTEAAHARAKSSQVGDAYTRDRLRTPRFTYFDEFSGRTEDAELPSGGSPFLDLVLGGGPTLRTWYGQHRGDCDPGIEVTICDDPLDLHCHTLLNQRLYPASMRMCQELTEAANALMEAFPGGTASPVLAAGCFVWLIDVLGLNCEQQATLCAFGLDYLSRYLEWAGTGSSAEVLVRRVEQVAQAAGIVRTSARRSPHPPASLSGLAAATDDWFFFPESVWMQFHWLVSSLPVDLAHELALAQALQSWVIRAGISHGADTR